MNPSRVGHPHPLQGVVPTLHKVRGDLGAEEEDVVTCDFFVGAELTPTCFSGPGLGVTSSPVGKPIIEPKFPSLNRGAT